VRSSLFSDLPSSSGNLPEFATRMSNAPFPEHRREQLVQVGALRGVGGNGRHARRRSMLALSSSLWRRPVIKT